MRETTVYNQDEVKHFHKNLEVLRKERNLSPARFAAKAVVPLATVTRILQSKVINPQLDTVISLAKALGVSVSELIGDASPIDLGESITIIVEGKDRVGFLQDVASIISSEGIEITRCFATVDPVGERARLLIGLPVILSDRLEHIEERIKLTEGVKLVNIQPSDNVATILDQADKFLHQGTKYRDSKSSIKSTKK